MHHPHNPSRRRLLHSMAAGTLSPLGRGLAQAALALGGGAALAQTGRGSLGFGPLRPVADLHTGLPLLMLPEGFSYRSFGWAGEALADGGGRMPGATDGMGIVAVDGEVFTLVRNHERSGLGGAFGDAATHYDAPCDGGTVTLRYDRAAGRLLQARGSLSGTLTNCAGGSTPWGSWLSCEEIVSAPGQRLRRGGEPRPQRSHGWVFEVPAQGGSDARPLTALGQFRHEAAVVDAADGTVYLTEDQRPAGFYRLLPRTPGRLADGGRLQMLGVAGRPDLRRGVAPGQRFAVQWLDIERPEQGQGEDGLSQDGVLRQGRAAGGSLFSRLEGLWIGRGELFFTSTDGGDAGAGQVWRFEPGRQELELFHQSADKAVMDHPDNLCLAPDGSLVICEDSGAPVQRLWWLDRQGGLQELARNNVQLNGELPGLAGDFRRAEWAGTCFSPDGRTLFANVYAPGFSVAISGPFSAWR
ncbi:MAG: DUF839 domain-containing protein [Burkholderiaceae bacterium]|nr:DUF839 domain-containing protein [Burkholderiaceae bacterium]